MAGQLITGAGDTISKIVLINSGKATKHNAWFEQTLHSSSYLGNRALLHIVIVCVSIRDSSFCRLLFILA